jgi:flagellar assembly protein FliH
MGNIVKQNGEIKKYSFSSLVPKEGESIQGVTEFNIPELKPEAEFNPSLNAQTIRAEREYEKDKMFKIFDTVREHRGLKAQEQKDFEERVRREVNALLEKEKKEAFESGYNEGREKGLSEIKTETQESFNLKVDEFASFIDQAIQNYENSLNEQKIKIYEMVKNLVKWITLKEVDSNDYYKRLLEKLILEINTKNNLVIRVNKEFFTDMDETISYIEKKLGQLKNVRVEVDHDLHDRGIILESENGIIDGSLVAQFNTLDKVFEQVGIGAENET